MRPPINWREVTTRRCRECGVVFSSLEGDTRFDRCADCTEIAVLVYEAFLHERAPQWRPLAPVHREHVQPPDRRTIGGVFAWRIERDWEMELWRRCRCETI